MKTLTIVIAILITQLSIAQESDNLGKMILKGRVGRYRNFLKAPCQIQGVLLF